MDWLAGKRQVTVRGPHVDLTLSIAGRSFVNSDGRRNMPSGEIFTGPVEDSVNGWMRFTYPALRDGREVEGVELVFEQGKVVQASARKNEAYLLSQLDTDAGARYLGEFAIGTNDQIRHFTKNILFDEKIGGTMHVAIGAGYPETGSRNQSSVHWDFICDMRPGERDLGGWRVVLPKREVCHRSVMRVACCVPRGCNAYRSTQHATRSTHHASQEALMFARDIMSSPVITVTTDTHIMEVARILRSNQISGVPVLDAGGKLQGVVTEYDLILRQAPIHEPHYFAVLSGVIPLNLREYRQYKDQLRHAMAVTAGELTRAGLSYADARNAAGRSDEAHVGSKGNGAAGVGRRADRRHRHAHRPGAVDREDGERSAANDADAERRCRLTSSKAQSDAKRTRSFAHSAPLPCRNCQRRPTSLRP